MASVREKRKKACSCHSRSAINARWIASFEGHLAGAASFSSRLLWRFNEALLAVSSSGGPFLSPRCRRTPRVGLFPSRHRWSCDGIAALARGVCVAHPQFPPSAASVICSAAALGLLRSFPCSEASSSSPQSRLRDLSCARTVAREGRGSVRGGRRERRGVRRAGSSAMWCFHEAFNKKIMTRVRSQSS